MAEQEESLYSLLGVDSNASAEEIKKAFRALSLRYHPDKVERQFRKQVNEEMPQASEEQKEATVQSLVESASVMYKRIVHANDTLSDPALRRRYDAGMIEATTLSTVSFFLPEASFSLFVFLTNCVYTYNVLRCFLLFSTSLNIEFFVFFSAGDRILRGACRSNQSQTKDSSLVRQVRSTKVVSSVEVIDLT